MVMHGGMRRVSFTVTGQTALKYEVYSIHRAHADKGEGESCPLDAEKIGKHEPNRIDMCKHNMLVAQAE